MDELAILQDAVKPFSTTTAIDTIERELGGPLGEFFDEISEAGGRRGFLIWVDLG